MMTKYLRFYILLIMLGGFIMTMNAGNHRALLIGLGKQQDKTWGVIHGDRDVVYMEKMLKDAGYKDIISLKNEKATKEEIVRQFRKLAERCKKGDIVYIHYSGHGQLMTDLNGDESRKWQRRKHAEWDEAWIPYDAYMYYGAKDKGEKHLCDDEVNMLLKAIRNKIGKWGEMIVAIDACHSGDATSGAEEECIRGVDVKFQIPRNGKVTSAEPLPEQWLTISACKPFQLATEMKDLNVGKLTYALYSLGKQIFIMDKIMLQNSLQQFMDMNKGRMPQSPVVSGDKK